MICRITVVKKAAVVLTSGELSETRRGRSPEPKFTRNVDAKLLSKLRLIHDEAESLTDLLQVTAHAPARNFPRQHRQSDLT